MPAYVLPETLLKRGWSSVENYEFHRNEELLKVQSRGWGWDYINTKWPPVLHRPEERDELLERWRHRIRDRRGVPG